ncbi:hypothetical protein [Pollutibacter soli]|uniref:hypothetical protein n=1 Tax=Pollutibacter soli TaxID=3034157 RepID=UPI0030134CD9
MVDVFTDDEFLLYSPSAKILIDENHPVLWLNLIGFNGQCWETFGPLTGFASFDPDDIFFFATEVNPDIMEQEDLLLDLETNPIPYMMLFSGSRTPGIRHKEFDLIHQVGEFPVSKNEFQQLKKLFSVEYKKPVYKLTKGKTSEIPHFAEAYFDEEDELLLLSAMTENGYHKLYNLLNKHISNMPPDPDISLHPSMISTADTILKRKIELNPYSKLFETPPDPETADEIEKLNRFMKLALPSIKSGKSPDIDAIAKQVGLDPALAAEVYKKTMNHVKKMKKT